MVLFCETWVTEFTIDKNSPVGTSDTSTKYLDSFDNLINVDNCLSI